MKNYLLAVLFFLLFSDVFGQVNIFENELLLDSIETCADYIYNNEFEKADKAIRYLESQLQNQPFTTFLWSLNYYWKNFPLTSAASDAVLFVDSLNKCIHISQNIINKHENDIESNLLLLTSKALLMMYYADNRNYIKAVEHIYPGYKLTMKSFSFVEKSPEFYYYTGLFNYYREKYPEAHPIYKPIVYFLRSGNPEKGIEELRYTSENCIFMDSEALFFLVIIYLNYENNLPIALKYAKQLNNRHPKNSYFFSKYIELLLLNNEYPKAEKMITKLDSIAENNLYIKMNSYIYKGMIEENFNKNYSIAIYNYKKGLELAENFLSYNRAYETYGNLGLSRIYERKNNTRLAKEYYEKAEETADYEYFFNK